MAFKQYTVWSAVRDIELCYTWEEMRDTDLRLQIPGNAVRTKLRAEGHPDIMEISFS
jgi:hypothetical protein